MIYKTMLDEVFPEAQLLMDGFIPPYRMNRNTNRGSIALYVTKDVPSRQISFKNNDKNIKHFFVEIKSPKEKIPNFMFI